MEWLNKLFTSLTKIFPRIWLVDPDESGVRVTLGTKIRNTPPGWYLTWPLIQTCEKIKVKTQVKDLRPQSVWTSNHEELTISGAIRYKISDARKAILEVYDYDQTIQALALGIIQRYISQRISNEISPQNLEEEILKGLRKASQGWGLWIEKVYITDLGKVRNLRLLLNNPQGE